jgi:hypothetical protein
MLTKEVWKEFVIKNYYSMYEDIDIIDIFGAVSISLLTIPIDIILSPLEIIAYIIKKVLDKNKKRR